MVDCIKAEAPHDGHQMMKLESLAVDEDEAKILHKRRLTREKMQRYRKGIVRKSSLLKQQAAELQRGIDRLMSNKTTSKSPWLLSWMDIAQALREDSEASHRSNLILKQLCAQQDHVIHMMRSWVDGCQLLRNSTWRNVTLLGNSQARKHGIDWITQNQYHNTDRVLQQYAFEAVGSGARIDDAIIDMTNPDCLQYVWRDQRDIHVSFDVAVQALTLDFFHGMFTHGPTALEVPPGDAETFEELGGSCRYAPSVSKFEQVNHLYRVFHTAHRTVFVGQNIHQDELLVGPKREWASNRMTWYVPTLLSFLTKKCRGRTRVVVDRASPTKTTIRKLTVASQGFHLEQNRAIPLDEEASIWGIDLSAYPTLDAKLNCFVHKATLLCNKYAHASGGMTKKLETCLAHVPH